MFSSKKALERRLSKAGCEFVRHGGKHDIWRNREMGKNIIVSHGGVKSKKTYLRIMKQAGIKD